MNNIGWRKRNTQYGQVERLYMGRFVIGEATYSPLVARGDPNCYTGHILLPGIKNKRYAADNIEDVKIQILNDAQLWWQDAQKVPAP